MKTQIPTRPLQTIITTAKTVSRASVGTSLSPSMMLAIRATSMFCGVYYYRLAGPLAIALASSPPVVLEGPPPGATGALLFGGHDGTARPSECVPRGHPP